MKRILNFSIIAHIDHGKSTLAQRLLSFSNKYVGRRDKGSDFDSMELEQERGITIKSKSLRILYSKDSVDYELNMIDTPGHVDFAYEVSKALYACEVAILLVDASKGVQAQTVSNAYKAIEQNLEIIPVINKIDLPTARIKEVEAEICSFFGFKLSEICYTSAKTGEGVEDLFETLLSKTLLKDKVESANPRALIYDSYYDEHLGVVALCLVDGSFNKGDNLYINSNKTNFTALKVGYFSPLMVDCETLNNGEVGFIVTGLKQLSQVRVGDTIGLSGSTVKPFPDFEEVKPKVFLGIYPEDSSQIQDLRKALEILNLSDSSFTYEPQSAGHLGYGFNCGFLGLLHADIVLERLKREFFVELVVTTPTVSYFITTTKNEKVEVHSAREYPDPTFISTVEEPVCKVEIIFPAEYLGSVLGLVNEKRGLVLDTDQLLGSVKNLIKANFNIPLSEIIIDFNDRLKSVTSGYASMSYEIIGYVISDIVKVSILIAGEDFPPLSLLIHQSNSERMGRMIVSKLKQELPRQQFSIALQATIGGKIIARETLPAFRKDVTAKLYGGDRTRKDKLLKKQKLGKKRMSQAGRVRVDKETFFKIIKQN
ncbi:elongation factor 4 [bacterium]|nr:elongation factor 4 [bacterium]